MSTKLHHDVRAFHTRFGHPVRTKPVIPSPEEMRFRLKLITEEYLELLDATTDAAHPAVPHLLETAGKMLRHFINEVGIKVDLPEAIDALGDLDFVIEGTRAVCGVDGAPVHDAIYTANMAKSPVYVQAKDAYHGKTEDGGALTIRSNVPDPTAKPTKPDGWTPPDIRKVLLTQGWEGETTRIGVEPLRSGLEDDQS